MHFLKISNLTAKVVNARRPSAIEEVTGHAPFVHAHHARFTRDVGQGFCLVIRGRRQCCIF